MMQAHVPPVFLDRDGTLIVDMHYLSDPEQVRLESGVIEGLSLLKSEGHPLFVLTNQSGIGRGFFSERDARRVNARVDTLLRSYGIEVTGWYLCPHVPDAACTCRKPLPGMAQEAAREWNLRLRGCYVIGDKRADLELAEAIDGIGVLVTTGYGREFADWAHANSYRVCTDLLAAAEYIVEVNTKTSFS